MSRRIEDYGFIGNMVSCALVGRDGSIDWLCLPRFDSDACFAALLGTPDHGRWLIAPEDRPRKTTRRYLPGTAILETTFETDDGVVTLTDFMPVGATDRVVDVIRIVRGVSGAVKMTMDMTLRFGYGRTVPWLRRRDYGFRAVAGPDAVDLVTPVALHSKDFHTQSSFTVEAGKSVPFTLAYHAANAEPRFVDDREVVLARTTRWWRDWSARQRRPEGGPKEWHEAIQRSLITLKCLSFHPTGAIVAAATTSLPEEIGGSRNWDYRYCWLRDSTLTLYAFLNAGFFEEADAFREWLLGAVAGHPEQIQIMYGLGGERRLTELELPWLDGFANSKPVRIGNAAHSQFQLDVYGELMDALHAARRSNLGPYGAAWRLQCLLLDNLERIWRDPDEGIWEVRGGRRQFTYSKMMSWVAFDRAIKAVEKFQLEGPVDRWRALRGEIHADVLARGYDAERNCFVQHYDGKGLDASLLLMAQVGFLPPEDPRFRGTVEAVERELMEHGFVRRYRTEEAGDGLAGGEASFVVCSFWLVDAYAQMKRFDDAAAVFERLLSIRNDLGLLAEEYDPAERRQLGNFPQAFSHVGLVNAAYNLSHTSGPATQRAEQQDLPQSDKAPDQAHRVAVDHD